MGIPAGEGEDMVCPKVPAYVRRSQFRLPNRAQTPVIMIGPGTGLAPFRGFIQERAWQKENGKTVGPTVLFFGCRNKDQDYIYREELEAWEQDGLLTLHTAFSRDQAEKRYVIIFLFCMKMSHSSLRTTFHLSFFFNN